MTPARLTTDLLNDLHIIETAGEVGTRYCGRLFAALGAHVVRVGDLGPLALGRSGEGAAAFVRWLDEGKQAAPDLGSALARPGLGPHNTLVLGGQTPAAVNALDQALARHGCTFTRVGLTWFGQTGPYAGWPGSDEMIQALDGIAFSFGLPGGAPTLPQGHAPQILAGVNALIGGLAALMAGADRPTRVDVNALESALCFTEVGAVTAITDPAIRAAREGINRFSPVYPSSVYATRDGSIGVMALTPAQWSALCEMIGRPDVAEDPRFATSATRTVHADEIDSILAPALATQPSSHWVDGGVRHRVPITPAPKPRDLPGHAHWGARNSFAPIAGSPGAAGPTLPYRFSFDGVTRPRPSGGARGPLTGIRVVDFSMGWAGPLAARYLAELGADVLKIESTNRPDWWRGWEIMEDQDPPAHELPRHFLSVNRGKRGLDLDLTQPEALTAARAIVARADVTIENQGPGVMDKLGLGRAEQRRLAPGIISICMPPFGLGGPLAGLRAYGSTVEQASGLLFVNGQEDWVPSQQHSAFGDPVAGIYGAAVALAALYGRQNKGGAEIELCQVECLFQLNADGIIADQCEGIVRSGSRRMAAAPVCVVAAVGEESWLALAVHSDSAWSALAALLGDASLLPQWSVAERKTHEDRIEAAIAGWAKGKEAAVAARLLRALGIAAAPVQPTHMLCDDVHLEEVGYWARLDRRFVGEHVVPHGPLWFNGSRVAMTAPAPTLGEHTAEVLRELA